MLRTAAAPPGSPDPNASFGSSRGLVHTAAITGINELAEALQLIIIFE
jgi:hypothetical protein